METVKVAYIDRDGTINVEKHFIKHPDEVELIPGSDRAIRLLNEAGYRVFGISNQSGIARGYFTIEEVQLVNNRVVELVAQGGGKLDEIFICPHHPEGAVKELSITCGCRKPATGMIELAIKKYGLKPSKVVVIGDRTADIHLGHNIGATTILVSTGYGKEEKIKMENGGEGLADYFANNLLEAVNNLLDNNDS